MKMLTTNIFLLVNIQNFLYIITICIILIGTGIFDPCRSIAKQLLLVEAALAAYRATRTPLRNKYIIEVGNTPDAELPALITGIKDRIKREKVLDNSFKGFDSIPDILGIEEDIWIPAINGTPSMNIEAIQPPSLDGATDDADYFKNKMLGSLGIPPSYLGQEERYFYKIFIDVRRC
jgi:hypothetical protein